MTSKKDTSAAVAENDSVAVNEPHKIKCGLIMPISKSQGLEPEHWLNVKGIICEALADTEFDVRLVSESDDVGVIHKSIVQNIYKNDIVICDVSTHNANVMFELGLRLAFNKPTVIIKDDETPFSFDTQVIEHIVYKRSLHYVDIVFFKKKLREKVLATLEQSRKPDFSTFLGHFSINYVATIEERSVTVSEALVERIEQMQNTINMIARQQASKNYSSDVALREPFGKRQIAGAEWAFKRNVRKYLNSVANASDMDEKAFANFLSNMSAESEQRLIKQFYTYGERDDDNVIPFPPNYVQDVIKAIIDEAEKTS